MLLKDWLLRITALAALILVTGGGVYAAQRYARLQSEQQILAQQLVKTRHAAGEIEGLLNRLARSIDNLVRSADLRHGGTIEARKLELLFGDSPPDLLLGIYQQDRDGNILAQAPPGWLQASGFPVHLLTELRSGHAGPRLIPTAPDPVIHLARPSTSAVGASSLNALVSSAALQRQVMDPSGDNFLFVLDQSRKVILHPNPDLIGAEFAATGRLNNQPEFHDLLLRVASGTPGAALIPERVLGAFDPHPAERQLALAFVPLNGLGGAWRLALATPAAGLEGLSRGHLASLLILLLGGAGVLGLLYTPVRKLAGTWLPDAQRLQLEHQLQELRDQLAAAELRNQQLLDNAGDALFFVDPYDGAILDQNLACEKLLGYTGAELATLSLSTLLPGAQSRKYLRLLKKVLKSGYGEASELQFRTKTGTLFTGAVHARLGSLGERRVVHGVIRDVTRLKQVEQELRQRNRDLTLINQITFQAAESQSLQEVLATVREMVIAAFDADGGGIYLSQHQGTQLELVTHEGIAEEILGELKNLPPGAGLVGRVLASGRPVSSANLDRDRRLWSQAVRHSGWRVLQSVPLGTRGKTIGVLFVFHQRKRVYTRDEVRLLQAIGQQVGTIIANADLFEELTWQNRLSQATNRELQASRKLLGEHLRRQQEATRTLERTEQMKNNFLALASHELRTPLTYILSGSQFLAEELGGDLPEAQKRILEAVHQGGKRLEEIVSNLLEIARIEAQSIYLGLEQIDLASLLEQLCLSVRPALTANRLSLQISRPLPVVERFRGDRDYLFKALQRLVENAIKFTPPAGQITLSARLLSGAEVSARRARLQPFREQFFRQPLASDYLQLTVADTGIGIAPEEQLQIFEKFYEIGDIDTHFTSRTDFGGKGIGLGLTLARGIVEAHNGLVWVESSGIEGEGSVFHLLLPLAETAAGQSDLLPEVLSAS